MIEAAGAELGPAGRAALTAARQAAPEDRYLDACLRYAEAVDDCSRIRAVWLGRYHYSVTATGSQGQRVPHPLLSEMRRARESAAALGARLGLDRASAKAIEPTKRGRPVGTGADPLDALAGALEDG